MTERKRYREFGDFLRERFPFKAQKIAINAGFTCPNRDGSKGRGGCTYCNNQTFNPGYCQTDKSVTDQLAEGVRFFSRKYPEMRYLAYFQAYTSTYGEQERLERLYEEALSYPGVVGLVIGTRPDCVPDRLLDYLARLSEQVLVLVEYGVESTLDRTLRRINRGHDFAEAEEAIRRTAARGIAVGAHLILGLPGESRNEILGHADRLSELPLTTLKLHQLQLIRHTRMALEFERQPEDFHLFFRLAIAQGAAHRARLGFEELRVHRPGEPTPRRTGLLARKMPCQTISLGSQLLHKIDNSTYQDTHTYVRPFTTAPMSRHNST